MNETQIKLKILEDDIKRLEEEIILKNKKRSWRIYDYKYFYGCKKWGYKMICNCNAIKCTDNYGRLRCSCECHKKKDSREVMAMAVG